MRMVSNRHVNTANMKRFKRVHIPHKVFIAKPEERAEEEPVLQVSEIVPAIDEYATPEVFETEVVVEAPKPKRSRKKKTEETVENNEEKPEDNG